MYNRLCFEKYLRFTFTEKQKKNPQNENIENNLTLQYVTDKKNIVVEEKRFTIFQITREQT